MTALLFRATPDFEVVGDGRTVEGVAFRWDTPSKVADDGPIYLEEFDRRATNRSLSMRSLFPVFVKHDHVGGSIAETEFQVGDEGLLFRARVSDLRTAMAKLDEIRNGKLRGASIGFRPLHHLFRQSPAGRVTRRTEIALAELSFLPEGAHIGSGVLAVRSRPVDMSTTPRLDALRRERLFL